MPANTRRPNPYEDAGSEAINAMVARVAPAILELLADGAPRTKPAIVEALAGRHDRQDVVHALIRLAVTGQVEESGGRYALGARASASNSRPWPGGLSCGCHAAALAGAQERGGGGGYSPKPAAGRSRILGLLRSGVGHPG